MLQEIDLGFGEGSGASFEERQIAARLLRKKFFETLTKDERKLRDNNWEQNKSDELVQDVNKEGDFKHHDTLSPTLKPIVTDDAMKNEPEMIDVKLDIQ